jgi:hypothetical protein
VLILIITVFWIDSICLEIPSTTMKTIRIVGPPQKLYRSSLQESTQPTTTLSCILMCGHWLIQSENVIFVWLVAFTAKLYNKIFPGYQPCQLARLVAKEYFIIQCNFCPPFEIAGKYRACYIPSKANGYVVGNGTRGPTIIFIARHWHQRCHVEDHWPFSNIYRFNELSWLKTIKLCFHSLSGTRTTK